MRSPANHTPLPNESACIARAELEDARRQLATLAAAGLPIPRHLQEWLKQTFDAIVTELLIYRNIINEAKDSACIARAELKDARRQLHTLAAAGLPIPHHLQEWLKQNLDAIITEICAYRRIIDEAKDSGPNVVPFPAPRNHAEEIANARAAQKGGATLSGASQDDAPVGQRAPEKGALA